MFGTSYLADKYHLRGPALVFNSVLALIGLPIMVSFGGEVMIEKADS
jgi:hypothetical protein